MSSWVGEYGVREGALFLNVWGLRPFTYDKSDDGFNLFHFTAVGFNTLASNLLRSVLKLVIGETQAVLTVLQLRVFF
jgi:hypothetical protein